MRAVTARLAARIHGEGVGQGRLALDRARGFAYVDKVAEALKRFEADPGRYPSFCEPDFVAGIARVLAGLAKR